LLHFTPINSLNKTEKIKIEGKKERKKERKEGRKEERHQNGRESR